MIQYGKDFMDIKFNTDDDLPLSKIINIPVYVIVVKSVIKEDNRYYPKCFLHGFCYEYEHEENTRL